MLDANPDDDAVIRTISPDKDNATTVRIILLFFIIIVL